MNHSRKNSNAALSLLTRRGYRVALYCRVSTLDQLTPEGSLVSQEQRLRERVVELNAKSLFGEVVEVFVDRGISAKDTKRPELQKMLSAIDRGDVTFVMVTDIARFSRSLKDFTELCEFLAIRRCGFLSLKDPYDTTTAAGVLTMNLMATLAQFERQQTGERVVANTQARSARGLYSGGVVPLGYKINPERKGYLEIEDDQAAIVRKAFAVFLIEGNLTSAGRWLNENGYRYKRKTEGGGNTARLGHFTVQNLHNILRNPAYIGIKTYKVKNETKQAKAVWQPLVEDMVFEKAQDLLAKNNLRKPDSPNRYPFELTGVLVCGKCGERLCGKTANGNGGKIPYYEHGWAIKRQACLVKKIFDCNPNRINATVLEPLVWQKVEELLRRPDVATGLVTEAGTTHGARTVKDEIERARQKIHGVKCQLEALTERLSLLPKSVPADTIYWAMEKLSQVKKEEEDRVVRLQLEGGSQDMPVDLATYDAFIAGVRKIAESPGLAEIKARIIQMLVRKIEVFPGTFKIHFIVSQDYLKRELAHAGSRLFLCPKSREKTQKSSEAGSPRGEDLNFNDFGSYSLKNGVPTGIRTPVTPVKGECPRPLDDGDAKEGRKLLIERPFIVGIIEVVNFYSQVFLASRLGTE